ncbi:hypothetical protein [Alteribacillus sp. YIM 98480]|uniref:hypothetical protein n=1 Tax=Alteribacillus sp. YIM 98480 TaxID=2606599 RepID=UPI00131B35B2|nr:hypothetical protein [Alteribacillus sp. YIM 98480]
MLEQNVNLAIHWWENENLNSSNNNNIKTTIPWLFKTGGALFKSIRYLTTGEIENVTSIQMAGENNVVINLEISPSEYFQLRGILAMTADLYRISTALGKQDTGKLKTHLNKVKRYSNKFRDLRNFFEHIDSRLINLDQHGISGETTTDCGIHYSPDTKNCFHLVFDGTSFHFSDEKKAKKRSFTTKNFIPIFEGLEGLYDEITSHKIHETKYPRFTDYYNYNNL